MKKTFRIFCEGEKTEPYYINGYLRENREDNRASVKVMDCRKNTPVQLVEAAIKFKDSGRSIDGDEFWVVYDREAIAKYSRDLHLKAWKNAASNDINIALSNVCFEYWLLLHFVDSGASYTSCDDLLSNSALTNEVKKVCGKPYSKASDILFEHIKGNTATATTRAEKINLRGQKAAGKANMPFDINPYTGVPSLIAAIHKF